MIFIADLTACSTCFGHHYAHHQELEYYTDGCCLWYLVLWFSSCQYGVELRVMCPVCRLLHHTDNLKTKAPNTTGSNHLYNTRAPDDGHNGARNMLSKQ
jgi:hypothetical protein